MTDTQPFMDEARELVGNRLHWFQTDDVEVLATALSSAYQRGREDAAKIVDGFALQWDPGTTGAPDGRISPEFSACIRAGTAIRTERDKG